MSPSTLLGVFTVRSRAHEKEKLVNLLADQRVNHSRPQASRGKATPQLRDSGITGNENTD